MATITTTITPEASAETETRITGSTNQEIP
jgi:hypothetical protein